MATQTEAIPIHSMTVLSINMMNVSKLTSNNYLMWSLQVHAHLDGHGLAGHLDGSTIVPTPTITANGVTFENLTFLQWKRQDKLIYSALIGAISRNLQPLVSRTTTAAEIWTKLSDIYAKPSR